MQWDDEATQMMREYLEAVRNAAVARGGDGDAIVHSVKQRLVAQVNQSGATVVTGELIRGVLAAAGSPDAAAISMAPPPVPLASHAPVPTSGKSGGSNKTCLIVGLVCLAAIPFILAIVGVLAAVFLPALSRAREAARRASCQNNLKQAGILFAMYANEHDNKLPAMNSDFSLEEGFSDVSDAEIFQCPSGPGISTESGIDYIYLGYAVQNEADVEALMDAYFATDKNPEALAALGTIPGPRGDIAPLTWNLDNSADIPLLIEWASNHIPEGANVLYLDGHVEFLRVGDKFPVTVSFFETLDRAW